MNQADLKNACTYIASELNRIETVAGTLSVIESEHYKRLTKFDHQEMQNVAVEEQSASRQLGMVKQMCVELAQKMNEIQTAIERGELQGVGRDGQAH